VRRHFPGRKKIPSLSLSLAFSCASSTEEVVIDERRTARSHADESSPRIIWMIAAFSTDLTSSRLSLALLSALSKLSRIAHVCRNREVETREPAAGFRHRDFHRAPPTYSPKYSITPALRGALHNCGTLPPRPHPHPPSPVTRHPRPRRAVCGESFARESPASAINGNKDAIARTSSSSFFGHADRVRCTLT